MHFIYLKMKAEKQKGTVYADRNKKRNKTQITENKSSIWTRRTGLGVVSYFTGAAL